MIRAFLAIELSPALRAELALVQQALKRRIEPELTRDTRISWTEPASIHLTLKFLGDMGEQIVDSLHGAIDTAIARQRVVTVPLERLGVFPRPQAPRILWVGPPEQWEQTVAATQVAEMFGAIEGVCEGVGFLREARPFSPHLTLARIKMGERHVGAGLAKSGLLDHPLSLGSLALDSVVLMQSELTPTGPIYTKLWEVRLQG